MKVYNSSCTVNSPVFPWAFLLKSCYKSPSFSACSLPQSSLQVTAGVLSSWSYREKVQALSHTKFFREVCYPKNFLNSTQPVENFEMAGPVEGILVSIPQFFCFLY